MALQLTPSQALEYQLFNLTKALYEGEKVKIDECYKKFKILINACLVRNKMIDPKELKTKVNIPRFKEFTPLCAAINYNDLNVARDLLNLGADPNQKNIEGWTSLHDAAAIGSPEMMELLIAYKGDIHAVKDGETPLHIAAENGHKAAMQCLMAHGANVGQLNSLGLSANFYIREYGFPEVELFAIDPVTAEIFARKFLAHVHGIGGDTTIVAGQKMKLTGFYTYPVCQILLPYLTKFRELHKEGGGDGNHYGEVLRAFHFAASARSSEEYLVKIQSGELTFIPTGWKNHAVLMAFKGDIAAVLNKGQGVTANRKPIQAFPIDKTRLTIYDIEAILAAKFKMNSNEGQEFFYHTLPQGLPSSQHANAKKLCDDLRSLYTPKLIDEGTCTYGALKAAKQFAHSILTLLKHPDQPYLNVERLSQIKILCSQFSTFCRLKSIHDYLIKHFGDVLDKDLKTIAQRLATCDFSLVERAWIKVNKRLVKEKHRSSPLSDMEKALGNKILIMTKKIKAAAAAI